MVDEPGGAVTEAPPGLAAAAPLPAIAPGQLRLLLLGLGLATGMEFYTFDSMNLVLPDLTGSLAISADEASWLLTIYSCSLFLGVPVSIWMAGHFGYKRFLLATIMVFAAASIGCAVSPGFASMLFCRSIQGWAGAGLVVWWRASIYVLLPKPQRSAALMQASTLLYLSSAAGLLVSGYITDHLHWRLIFLPCLIYAVLAMGLLIRYFPTLPAPSRSRADDSDWLGMVLLAIALVSLQIILSRGEIDDWFGGRHIRQLAWLGGTALLLFVTWQASDRNRTPLLKLGLLRDRRVLSAALIGTSTGMILSGSLFLLPEFLRDVANATRSATQTGQVMCIYALTAAGIRPLMVGLIARLGQRKTIALAMLMLLASMTLFNRLLTADTPVGYLVIPLLLYACCLSPLLPAVGSGTVAKIEQNKLLDGVSLYMTFRQFGASLGVALLTILISRRESLHSSRLFEHVQAGSPLSRAWLSTAANLLRAQGGYTRIEAHDAALAALAHTGARQAAVLSYADGFLFMAAVAAATLCLIPVIPPTPVVKP